MDVPFSLWRHGVASYLKGRPYCVSFELTHNCNARCQHCHRGIPVSDDDRATPAQLLEVCRKLHPVVAGISGGEPLLCHDVVEVVRTLKQGCVPMRLFLNTNAALLTRAKYDELCEAGIDEFLISFDYPDERHDDFRRIPGLFDRIRTLVGGLSPEGRKRVVLTSVFQRENFRDMPRMARLGAEWGVNVNFSAYTWLRTNDKGLMVPADEIGELREMVRELQQLKRTQRNILTSDYVLDKMVEFFERGSMNGCRAGDRFLVVNPDGTLSPCGLLVRSYATHKGMIRDFTQNNHCADCYTSSRANSGRPTRQLLVDNLKIFARS